MEPRHPHYAARSTAHRWKIGRGNDATLSPQSRRPSGVAMQLVTVRKRLAH
jgi:hypothetical protein